jgi:hypothetical protein
MRGGRSSRHDQGANPVTGHDDADEREAQERWIELGIRVDIPHPARVYDYMLGRKIQVVHGIL